MTYPWFAFALIGALCVAACGARTVSGAYVFSSPTEVVMLQLVESPEGSLAGSLQMSSANQRHEVRTDSVALSGTIDDNTLTLSTPTFLGRGTTFSGARSGNEITLTFTSSGNVNTMAFRRSTPQNFATLTERLREDQRQQAQEKARQQAAAQARAADERMRTAIPALSAELEQSAANAADTARQVDAAAGQFATFTQRARTAAAARDRENDEARQHELSMFIHQVSVETTQLDISVEQTQRDVERHRDGLREHVQRATAWCAHTRDAVCARFTSASEGYASAYGALAAALGRADAAHQRAEQEQDQL